MPPKAIPGIATSPQTFTVTMGIGRNAFETSETPTSWEGISGIGGVWDPTMEKQPYKIVVDWDSGFFGCWTLGEVDLREGSQARNHMIGDY